MVQIQLSFKKQIVPDIWVIVSILHRNNRNFFSHAGPELSIKSVLFSVGLCPTVRGEGIEVAFLKLWECTI